MSYKLLTIAIPTYNRPDDLDRSLASILPQVKRFEEYIEFLVSDNASTRDNASVIEKYRRDGYVINYIVQETNLGMDGNFTFIYNYAKTKYVWMLSDDDLLINDGVEIIIGFLSSNKEVSSLYLGNIWYDASDPNIDLDTLMPKRKYNIMVYTEPLKYFEQINYWITFLSANIINKDLLYKKVDTQRFQGTFLALLSWIIPAIFQEAPNAIIEGPILICKGNNQGGYKLVEVFANNFNKVLDYFVNQGLPKQIKEIINRHLLREYFPYFIMADKENKLSASNYLREGWIANLMRFYYNDKNFYLYILPAFQLSKYRYNQWMQSKLLRFLSK
ncbi:glycosyltransferase family A protein [Hymenobacter rubidus]|uniref:glycosyltransferase family A protein n=1 Tax=Hymenobacter rubidus TaxID=1441626 RepID=UPI00191F78DA|nr:glycosyltransferase family A protein [Hymenobacter rubidus]